jgi:translation initiation factor IF-2
LQLKGRNVLKKVKVKNLAEKFGLSPKEVLKELESEGIEVAGASSVIPPDMLELIEIHLEDFVKKGQDQDTSTEDDDSNKVPVKVPEVSGNKEMHMKSPVIVKALAEELDKKPNEIITVLMSMNVLANINQALEPDVAAKVAANYGFELVIDRREKEEHIKHSEEELFEDEEPDNPEDLQDRPPVVTFLGHVDHGKTSLQDRVRKTNVVDGEAGGITQHIGASTVTLNGKQITFIDTPGHEAFTAMRARGANITDIAILVVAADDGFMPQTVEALNHAKAAGVPVIVAMNKIDLPSANPDTILRQMQENGLMSEDWGGDIAAVRVSAKTGEGCETLLERILLESEMLELKANPKRPAEGVVLESQLEQGFGPTASILVRNGTLKVGDVVLCGEFFGKVKTMIDEMGKPIKTAGPSTPVKLVGLSGVPEASSKLRVCKNEKDARLISEERTNNKRAEQLTNRSGASLEDLFTQAASLEQRNDLNIILKSDVKGSGEAIIDSLDKLPSEKIKVNTVMAGVGAITENDVLLASASNAIVIGFHVRVNPGVNKMAKQENVEIRLYSIIYELLEDITDALMGRLAPDKREKDIGKAKILQIFGVSKGPNVCGCMIESGYVKVGSKARVYRDGELIYNGEVRSLRRFQDDVKEVKQGLECGIRLDNFRDFHENDNIEFYDIELKKATL